MSELSCCQHRQENFYRAELETNNQTKCPNILSDYLTDCWSATLEANHIPMEAIKYIVIANIEHYAEYDMITINNVTLLSHIVVSH